jgi:hypothetical protein
MQATLRESVLLFGLTHPESLSNLTRQIDQSLSKSRELWCEIEGMRQRRIPQSGGVLE